MGIFEHIKILDLTKVFSGPFATRQFADLGAEVLKIEHSALPDDSREYAPLKNGWSGYFEILNRNKKGIALNLKEEKDLEVFYRLVQDADVIVENLTPQIKHKLKIDYETVQRINPQIIYASISGKGQRVDEKYYDVIAQAESGLMSLSGLPDMPLKIGPSVVDAFTGMSLAFGISSALYYRQVSGKGQYVDVSLLSCAMNLLEANLIEYSIEKKNPVRPGNQDNAISPFGVYKTQDGYLALAIGNNTQWKKFIELLDTKKTLESYSTNEIRLKENARITQGIETLFAEMPSDKLVEKLHAIGIACCRVFEMSDVATHTLLFELKALAKIDHPKLGEIVIPGRSVNFSESDDLTITNAPEIGEHNDRYGI